jgi:hypothetical protein
MYVQPYLSLALNEVRPVFKARLKHLQMSDDFTSVLTIYGVAKQNKKERNFLNDVVNLASTAQ